MSARKVFVKDEGNDDEEWHGVVELSFPSLKLTTYAEGLLEIIAANFERQHGHRILQRRRGQLALGARKHGGGRDPRNAHGRADDFRCEGVDHNCTR